MAAPCYIAWTADTSASTGPPALVTVAASTTKTLLQLKPGSAKVRVIEWGYGFSAVPAVPVQMELVETGTVFATVTTIGSGVRPYNDVTGSTSLAVTGTAATGFNATAEGTITASRLLGYTYENGMYFKQQFPLGREPEVNAGASLRIRATTAASGGFNGWAYFVWEE